MGKSFKADTIKGATTACIAAAACFAGPYAFADSAELDEDAPSFSMVLYDKSKLNSEELAGKVVVINYWATWCAPCKSEMPMMSRFFAKHEDKGLAMFGVVTKDSVPMYKLKKVSELLSYPLVRKFRDSGDYGTINNAVPTTYIIGRAGKIRYAKEGVFSEREFRSVVLPLLEEQPFG